MAPRARYHTSQDDSRDTSVDSLWHMLSAALATVKGLSEDTSSTFERRSQDSNEPASGKGSNGVWFDVLGRAFAVMQMHTLFSLSVTLLVAGPVLLILLEVIVRKLDKWYPFSRKRYLHNSDDDEPTKLYGWRGFFRYPLSFVVASGVVVALAYLITKINPYIVYSSEYAVWSMMLAAWLFLFWFLLRLGDSLRPSALSRMYSLFWLYALTWVALVAATVGENNLHIGSGYFVVIYNAAAFAALLISYLELFALPKKSVYVEHAALGPDQGSATPVDRVSLIDNTDELPRSRDGAAANDADEANERTSLLAHTRSRQTFTRRGRRGSASTSSPAPAIQDPLLSHAYEGEQAWSSSMPRWTWLLQFLLLAPINVILIGQLALLVTSALHQTPADGNPVLTIYVLAAALSVLLLLPTAPFLHRMTYQIPTFLFFVFVATLIYNLLAFPFSRDARLKIYFTQRMDLDHGNNTVALVGLNPYVRDIALSMPSAAGHGVSCGGKYVPWASRNGLEACTWAGLEPRVVPSGYSNGKEEKKKKEKKTKTPYKSWLEFDARRSLNGSGNEAVFDVKGYNTRGCRLIFNTPLTSISIAGAGADGQGFQPSAQNGTQIRLWSREWDGEWRVRVSWAQEEEEEGRRMRRSGRGEWRARWCIGTIPALDEVRRYMPVWSAVSKGSDGLVEGYKRFSI
ncbi:hypothetical protein H2203_007683 [Taxawa tesnikishii (nom. ined.)]|nr:hypothetical protein H2203_007683 [Dothideales sp. JES 119]